ncbi:MAG: cytochrome c family protein, partial [Hyphomicrobiaceae bacterium]
GIKMSYAGVHSEQVLADLLVYLRTLSDKPEALPAIPAAAPAKGGAAAPAAAKAKDGAAPKAEETKKPAEAPAAPKAAEEKK